MQTVSLKARLKNKHSNSVAMWGQVGYLGAQKHHCESSSLVHRLRQCACYEAQPVKSTVCFQGNECASLETIFLLQTNSQGYSKSPLGCSFVVRSSHTHVRDAEITLVLCFLRHRPIQQIHQPLNMTLPDRIFVYLLRNKTAEKCRWCLLCPTVWWYETHCANWLIIRNDQFCAIRRMGSPNHLAMHPAY